MVAPPQNMLLTLEGFKTVPKISISRLLPRFSINTLGSGRTCHECDRETSVVMFCNDSFIFVVMSDSEKTSAGDAGFCFCFVLKCSFSSVNIFLCFIQQYHKQRCSSFYAKDLMKFEYNSQCSFSTLFLGVPPRN
jgi:hypothetical protein